MGFAFGWPLVLLGRFIDRFGKGVRTSARDALIAESSTSSNRGKSFGFHRALDTAGAVVGPLLAIWLLHSYSNNFRSIFLVAFIPGLIGILLLLAFVREKKKKALGDSLKLKGSWKEFDISFKIFLAISVIFAIGNSSDAFLILRSQNLGLSAIATIFAYVVFNFSYALFSVPAGAISDRVGPRKVLISGFFLFGLVYLLFGIIHQNYFLWFIFPLYGIYMALTEGIGKAYISNLVPPEKTGTAFGIYQTAIGICTFFASLIAGLLWDKVSVSAPFILGSAAAIVSAILFIVLQNGMGNKGKELS